MSRTGPTHLQLRVKLMQDSPDNGVILGNSDKESRQTERVDLNLPEPSEPNAAEINKHTPSRPSYSKDVEQEIIVVSPEDIQPDVYKRQALKALANLS